MRLLTSQRNALLTEFLFARNARIFAARQSLATKTTKTRAFYGKNFFKASKILCPGFKSAFVTSSACFWASGTLPKPRAACFRALGVLPRLPSQGRALLTTFCLLAMLAFLPQGRALRQKPQKFAAHFQSSGTLPKPRAACFRALGAFPRLPRRVFGLRERSHDFPDTFSTFGSAPEDFPKRFHLSKVLLLLPRRVFGLRERSQNLARLVFGLWECSIATRCTALSFGSLPECSHRHCPRVARKSYKIFSSGG